MDNQRRFSLFCRAAVEALRALPFMPGEDAVIVANDWHTAMVPVLLKDLYQPRGEFTDVKTALTVHNIAFQGRFWDESFASLGLPASSRARFDFSDGFPEVFDEANPVGEEGPDFSAVAPGQRFPKLNWLAAGVDACDKLLTVSPNYALEIQSGPALGVELDGRIRAKGVEGIVNGMDVADWNPATDKFLALKYNAASVEAGKGFAKAQLQREAGLPVDAAAAVFGFIGRLEEQKGVDILARACKRLPAGAPIQVVVLGTGKKAMEAEVAALSDRFPGRVAGVVAFSNPLAHLITAGADFMVVPSRFEPCGLIQLHAMAYGTVPLVASTGGLVDTVKEGVTGFQMGAMDPDGLAEADVEAVAATMERAAEVYGTPAHAAMRDACIAQDLSWAAPAAKWEAVLAELKFGTARAPEAAAAKASVPTPVQRLDNPGAYAAAPGPKPSEVAAAIFAAKAAAAPAGAGAAPAPAPPAPAGAAAFPKPAVAPAAAAAAAAAMASKAAAPGASPNAAASIATAQAALSKSPSPLAPGAKPAAAAPAAAKPAAAAAAKPAAAAAAKPAAAAATKPAAAKAPVSAAKKA